MIDALESGVNQCADVQVYPSEIVTEGVAYHIDHSVHHHILVVSEVSDGRAAWTEVQRLVSDIVVTNPPALVVLDLTLTGMSGRDVLAHLR